MTVDLAGVAFDTATHLAFVTPKLLILRLSAVLGLAWLSLIWAKKKEIRFPKQGPPWLGALLTIAIVRSGLHYHVQFLSQGKTLEYIGWIMFFLVAWLASGSDLSRFSSQERMKRIGRSLGIVELLGIPLVAYGLLQHFSLDPIQWKPGGNRVFAFLQNADAFASLQAVLLGMSTFRFLLKPNVSRLFLILGEFSVLFWSYTRGPFVALGASALLLFILILCVKALRPLAFRFCLVFLAAVVLFGALLGFSRGSALVNRFNPSRWGTDADIVGRKYLFTLGMESFTLHPWTGVGPGNFQEDYFRLRSNSPGFYQSRIAAPESTHNTILDLFVETGFVSGMLFLALWGFSFASLFKAIRSGSPEWTNVCATLFVMQSIAFVCLQFIYPDVSMEALTAYLLSISFLLAPYEVYVIKLSPVFGRFMASLTILLALFVSGYAMRVAIADFYLGRADSANDKVLDDFTNAVAWNPWDPGIYHSFGRVQELRGNSRSALINYNLAVRINDRNPFVWADIGRLAAKNRWRKRALTAYRKAIILDPYNPNWYHDAAYSALSLRAFPMALFCSREAFRLKPQDSDNGFFLAQSLLQAGRLEEAISLVNAEVARFPRDQNLLNLQRVLSK